MKIENLGVFSLNLKIEIIIVLSFHPGNLLFLFSFYGIIRNPRPTSYHLLFSTEILEIRFRVAVRE